MSEFKPSKGFLDLPQELRDQIYGYLMVKQKTTITMLPQYGCFQSPVSAAQPALCWVNKQIRAETLPIFYSSNLFLAEISDEDDLGVAKQWISAVGDDSIRHVHRLALCGWTGTDGPMRWIRAVFNLKNGTLEIEDNQTLWDRHPHVVKDTSALKEAYQELVASRKGEEFDGEALEFLMEGFHALCLSY